MLFGSTVMSPVISKIKITDKDKYGATIDSFLGDVDENGVLQAPTKPTELNFAGVKRIASYSLAYCFYKTGITSVDLSSVTTVDGYGLSNAFSGCRSITSVVLSSLQSVGANGLYYAFYECRGLTTISFPSLTSVHTTSFNSAFSYCSSLTEIHFRADMQATIETMSGYSSKWGATNATIYFDL